MPIEYNQVLRGELQQRIARGLEIRGEKSPCRTLDPTLQAVVLVEDLTQQSPFLQPGERRAAGGDTVPAVVGAGGFVTLECPQGSGIVVVMHSMTLTCGASAQALWGRSITAGVAIGGTFFDSRHGIQSSASLTSGQSIGNPIATELGRIALGVSTSPGEIWQSIEGLVLNPGEMFTVWCETVNQPFGAYLVWTEYIS